MNLHRSVILYFNHLYPRAVLPLWFLAAGTATPSLENLRHCPKMNPKSCRASFGSFLCLPDRDAVPCLCPQGHTSLFGIVGFHAANVGGFFGHQDFHEFGEAVFELSCCLGGKKKENYTWKDELELARNQWNTRWEVCIQIMSESSSFKKREQPQPPAALEFSPFQVSFCLSALSCQSTGLWWGSLSCTWSAERDVFRDEVQRATRETWGQNYFK